MGKFVTGALWGAVVAVGGLGVLSQIAPLQRDQLVANEIGADKTGAETDAAGTEGTAITPPEALAQDVPPPGETGTPEAGLEPAAEPVSEPAPEAASEIAAAPQAPDPAKAETEEPLLQPLKETDAPPPSAVVPDLPAVTAATDTPAPDAPASGAEPKPDPAPMEPEPAESAAEAATPEAAAPEAATAEPAAPEAVAPEATSPEPAGEAIAPAAPSAAEASPAAAPESSPETTPNATPATEAAAAPEATQDPAPEAAASGPSLLVPDNGLGKDTVEGVTTNRLPVITAEPEPAPAEPDAAAASLPAADLPPVQRFARSFENPDAKPLFAILLVDTGAPDVPRADLAALPFAVTFVLDPLQPGAAEAEKIYRAAGQEVVMQASGIPEGATAGDLEQSFAALDGKLPEAVALIDLPVAVFQDDRKRSAEIATLLAARGLGLVTFDRGLNAADQVAQREGLPAATIFRSLDDDGEDAPLIRRYLDRAAFKAAQEGEVAVIGTARAETIAALMEWAVEGRASSVALAPITALMAGN